MRLYKMCNVTHFLMVIGKDVVRLFHTMFNITYFLKLVIRKVVMRMPVLQNVHYSLAVGHSKRSNENAFHKIFNVAHILSIIGKNI